LQKSTTRWLLLALMVATAATTLAMRPTRNVADTHEPVELSTLVPRQFGGWTELPNPYTQVIDPQQQESLDRIYSQSLSRTYVDARGYRVMLSLVYGKTQRGNLQLHHPEICYPAQGFEVLSNRTGELTTPFGAIAVRRLETRLGPQRIEPVTYWAMVGDRVVLDSTRRKLVELRYGLRGYLVDGMLFRISSVDASSPRAFENQSAFVADLLNALPPERRHLLAGV
jgi:EpsI family protein